MSYHKRHIHHKIKRLKPRKIFFKRFGFWVVLGVMLCVFLVYYGVFGKKLQVSEVEVLGSETIEVREIEAVIQLLMKRQILNAGFFSLSSRSILLIDKKNTIKNILNAFPKIKEVTIEKNLPPKVIISVKEREPFAVFCQNLQDCFWVDEDGIIFEKAEELADSIIIRKEMDDQKMILGETAVGKNTIEAISKIQRTLEGDFQIRIKEVLVSNPLIIKTSENWKIYFDGGQDADAQITKMSLLLKNEISPSTRKNLEYLYLQYKDRAYFR